MWKLKKELWPKTNESMPTGKINHQGKIVTSPDEIKSLLSKEYGERLRDRPAHPDFERIFETKKYSFRLKMEEANSNKSPDWKISELEDVLDEIKKE